MRQLQPQVDQGDQHPVDEDQLVIWPGTGRPLTVVAAPFVERRLAPCRPRASHFLDQIAEMCTIKAAEGRMGQGRAGQEGRHNPLNLRGRRHVTSDPALPRIESLGSET
ncbi:hypothetical protein ACFTZF_38145 [Streptomyces mirabilis]|uniref:hypothetical protein n=1 Tax=Streptomyces mirabilis TaxID=68239 RepID=UPI00363AA9D9